MAGYKEIANLIRNSITQGKYKPGDRLPVAQELCQEYGVSGVTIDRALRCLAQDRLIKRYPGRGTFVTDFMERHLGHVTVLIPGLSGLSTFPDFVGGIQDGLSQRGYDLVIIQTRLDIETTISAVKRAAVSDTRGVIYIPAYGNPEEFHRNAEALNYLHKKKIPVVAAGHCDIPGIDWLSSVSSNHFAGAKNLVNHLLACGHQNIGIMMDRESGDQREILRGYRAAMEEHNITIPKEWIMYTPTSLSYSTIVKRFIQIAHDITAIFAVGDALAADAIKGLADLNMRVPQDIAIVGFGDTPLCNYLPVGLTTACVRHEEEGNLLANMIADIIEGRINKPTKIELPCSLVIRESCGVTLRNETIQSKSHKSLELLNTNTASK